MDFLVDVSLHVLREDQELNKNKEALRNRGTETDSPCLFSLSILKLTWKFTCLGH